MPGARGGKQEKSKPDAGHGQRKGASAIKARKKKRQEKKAATTRPS